MLNLEQEIEYGFLNMRTKHMESSYNELVENLQKGDRLSIFDNEYGQVLYVGGPREVSRCEVVLLCRKLNGLDRFENIITNEEY